MKRRLFGIIGALVLALLGTVVLVSYVKGAEDRALAGEKTVKVLVAAEPIEAGTPAKDLEGKLEFERIPQKVRAEGAVTSIGQLGDRVTETELLQGEQVVKSRFIEESEAGSAVPGSTGGENLLQQTVALEPERAIGGQIKQGDIVAVVGSFDPFDTPTGKTPNQTHVLIHKVRVTNVQIETSPGAAAPEPESDNEGEDAAEAPSGRFLVTVALSAPNVERVTFTAEFGHLWLAAEPKEADETGTKIVVLDNVWS
ncbi:MAG: Flp pilus assembly protein CpaB [Actinomycetota bacterium]